MEVFNPPSLQPLRFSLPPSQFLPKFAASARPRRNPRRFRASSSKLDNAWPWLSFPKSRSLTVSAHFPRRGGRRNFLRKKLAGDQKVRLDNPPDHHLGPSPGPQAPSFAELGNAADDSGEGRATEQRVLGESVLLNKLESWADQYKKDVELWGVGSGPVFTVVLDSDGSVKRVAVDEDEILKRSGIVSGTSKEASLKILRARSLAREMEAGDSVIPRNSSVAKFVVSGKETGFLDTIRELTRWSDLRPKLSVAGRMALCGLVVVWAVKFLSSLGKSEVKRTQLDKEMVRRKMTRRKEKEMLEKAHVEVVQEASEPSVVFDEKPKLDKEELVKNIRQMRPSNSKLVLPDYATISENDEALGMHAKIEEIREMANRAREIEAREPASVKGSVGDEKLQGRESDPVESHDESLGGNEPMSASDAVSLVNGSLNDGLREGDEDGRNFSALDLEVPVDIGNIEQNVKDGSGTSRATDSTEVIESSDPDPLDIGLVKETSVKRKPRIILSVKEAREYLSSMSERQENDQETPVLENGTALPRASVNGNSENQRLMGDKIGLEANSFNESQDPIADPRSSDDVAAPGLESLPSREDDLISSDEQDEINHIDTPSGDEINGSAASTSPSLKTDNWIEENFDEVKPTLEKIAAGFRDNYTAAKEKVSQNLDVVSEMSQLGFAGDDELEWMKDDNLCEIVFQVRENELAGRDPFYSMDAVQKSAFFEGLEKKVAKENERLQNLHEFLHSNIENLDYGADGISLYDPPEKIIPRWKGPRVEKNPEVMKSFLEEREAFLNAQAGVPFPMKKDEQSSIQESKQATTPEAESDSHVATSLRNSHSKDSKKAKIVIEGSDGSVRAGKKSGTEYWQHTKKWSRGFLDSYSAETDPEVKSVMKDIGKDLDRWITEKEIAEAADLMDKLPDRNKKFIEKKLDKVKREMELFGPQAVVSKYKEYAEDKEEDYLWWLDLPHVLCIELYTMQEGEQKVGFYSLEMAEDLELEPKPYHVIAFEDPGDCKNLCYIIQAHMEMLGNGHAFVVARPPKDAFREAKANGFGVTVIRKGELQLNVDQTLEEVEEQITEIGSKVYHDAIMKDRSVDMNGLMKGVFGVSGTTKPRKRRSKRKLKKPSKKGR